jgi:hypothetical protein
MGYMNKRPSRMQGSGQGRGAESLAFSVLLFAAILTRATLVGVFRETWSRRHMIGCGNPTSEGHTTIFIEGDSAWLVLEYPKVEL